MKQQASLARQVIAVLGRSTPALRPATGRPELFAERLLTLILPGSGLRPAADRSRASRPSFDDYRPGAWKVPAAFGGIVVSFLLGLSVWIFTPATEGPQKVYAAEPLPPHLLFHPINARPAMVVLGNRIYSWSATIPAQCAGVSVVEVVPPNQYQRFSAILGIPDGVQDDRVVRYEVQIDGVTRAEGQVSSATGPKHVNIPVNSPAKVTIIGTVVTTSPTTSCSPIDFGIGSPGFW